ncbi:MAG TPA: hypothetical protein GXZ95_05460 [Mollicutes bacterium]|nr:hypothetical protein [Mollicutes bacterium]
MQRRKSIATNDEEFEQSHHSGLLNSKKARLYAIVTGNRNLTYDLEMSVQEEKVLSKNKKRQKSTK